MWFHFHSSESLCNCNDVYSGLEFESLSSSRFLREWIVNVSFSNELLGMATLLEFCPIHFWIIRTLLTIELCYPILCPWSSVYVKDSHFQCPYRNSIPYTSVFSNKRVCSWSAMRFSGSYNDMSESDEWYLLGRERPSLVVIECWLKGRHAKNDILLSLIPIFSDQTSSIPSKYSNNHQFVSLIHGYPLVNNCTHGTR